jgi:hypothetical protein
MRLLLCLLALSAVSASAQFDVSMKLPRANFMALEAINATVNITNRTGAEADHQRRQTTSHHGRLRG